MITRYMNTEEAMKELRKDDEFLNGRMDGLGIKNSKKLKNRFVKSGDIMSESKYIVPETKDTLVAFAMKHVMNLKGKDYSTMNIIYYMQTSYGTYIIPIFKGISERVLWGYMEFSVHAVERIWERMGKGFKTFFKEDYIMKSHGTFQIEECSYNGKTESVACFGDAFAFVEQAGNRLTIKTVVSENELFNSQIEDRDASTEGGKAAWADMLNDLASDYERNFKLYNAAGCCKRVIA